MNYIIALHPRARKELFEAWVWYEERQQDLGDRFETEVYNRLEQIQKDPERYPNRKESFRETKTKTFPYLIIYKIEKEQNLIIVFSIFHTSRNPKLKYK